jgi:hypothetical protein
MSDPQDEDRVERIARRTGRILSIVGTLVLLVVLAVTYF